MVHLFKHTLGKVIAVGEGELKLTRGYNCADRVTEYWLQPEDEDCSVISGFKKKKKPLAHLPECEDLCSSRRRIAASSGL